MKIHPTFRLINEIARAEVWSHEQQQQRQDTRTGKGSESGKRTTKNANASSPYDAINHTSPTTPSTLVTRTTAQNDAMPEPDTRTFSNSTMGSGNSAYTSTPSVLSVPKGSFLTAASSPARYPTTPLLSTPTNHYAD